MSMVYFVVNSGGFVVFFQNSIDYGLVYTECKVGNISILFKKKN